MWLPIAPGIAEAKRLFVYAAARGLRAGSALVGRMLDQARDDGYREMRLETARFLTNAPRLYAGHGFVTSEHASDVPLEARAAALYMRSDL